MKHNVEAFKKYYVNATKEEVIEDMFLDNCNLQQEIEKLHSIIKEVRENINKKLNVNSDYVDYDFGTELLRQELLEILDKENSNGDNK